MLTVMSGIMANYVEIILRHIFMPIAIANVSHEGVRSAGVRYIKKYLGCFAKLGAIMVSVSAIYYVYGVISAATSMNWHKVVFFIMIPAVAKQVLKMCGDVVNEAMGD